MAQGQGNVNWISPVDAILYFPLTRPLAEWFHVSGGEIRVPPEDQGDGVKFIPFGIYFEVTPSLVKDGNVQIDATISQTSLGHQSASVTLVQGQSTRMITTGRLGEVFKLRFGKGEVDNQLWIEISVVMQP